VPEAYPARGRRWHEQAFNRAGRRAVALVAPSADVAADITAAGVAAPVTVITHGTDHLGAPDGAGAEALLVRLGVEGDFLLSVGTLEPRKNLVRLVEAYRRARTQMPTALPLVVVGPDGWGATPPWLSGSAPVTGVVPTGPVDDATLSALYQRARLLAYVPLREGFGFPPVEAMRAGTPVVASAMPSLGGAGLVVDPTDVDAMADALARVATDEGLRQALVAEGRLRVEPLTWAAAARAHMALWESVA
jgi:alpha-1,3-rhamnosyl/mannosyltransferase